MKNFARGLFVSVFLLATPLAAEIPNHLDVSKAQSELDAANFEVEQKESRYQEKVRALFQAEQVLRQNRKSLQRARERVHNLEVELEDLDQEISNINEYLPKLEERIDHLEHDREDAIDEREQAQTDWEARKSELEPIQQRLRKIKQRIDKINSEIEPKRRKLAAAQSNLKKAKDRKQNLTIELNQANQQIKKKNGQINTLTSTIQQQQTEINGLTAKVKSLEGELKTAEQTVKKLSKEIDKVNKQIEEAIAAGDKEKLIKLRAKKSGLVNSLREAVIVRDRTSRSLNQAKKSLTDTKKSRQANIRRKTTLEGEVAQIKRKLPKIVAEIRKTDERIIKLNSEIASLQNELKPMYAKLKQLQERKNKALGELAAKNREVQQALKKLDRKKKVLAKIESNLRSARDRKRTMIARRNSLQNQRPALRRRLASAREEARRLRHAVQVAESEVEDAEDERDRAENALDFAKAQATKAQSWFDQVLANYNRERDNVINVANAEAKVDGGTDGDTQAQKDGTPAGVQAGKDKGKAEGLNDGRDRDHAQGYRNGRAQATDPANKNVYLTGINQGKSLAAAKAQAESFPKGYNDSLEALLGAAPKGFESISLLDNISDDPGAQGKLLTAKKKHVGEVKGPFFPMLEDPDYNVPEASEPKFSIPDASKKNFSPPCSNLILDEFVPLCKRVYGDRYQSSFENEYGQVFRTLFEAGFNSVVQAAYDLGLLVKHEDETKKGYAVGVEHQGTLDGFNQDLAQAQIVAYAAGKAQLGADLAKGHLIRLNKVALRDSNEDGLLTPGEMIYLDVTLDNYGKMASPLRGLRVIVESAKGLEPLSDQQRELPALAAQTRTELTHVIGSEVSELAGGDGIELRGRVEALKDGSFVTLVRFKVGGEARFPLELMAIDLPEIGEVGEEVPAIFTFQNNTSDTIRDAEAKLKTDPNFVEVIVEDPSIATLPPGESFDLEAAIKPGVWVGGSEKIKFVSQILNIPGIAKARQSFHKTVPVFRNASLELFTQSGKPLTNGRLRVRAGGRLRFRAKFVFHAKKTKRGPFIVRRAKNSDPGIKNSNHSTVSINYGSMGPGSKPSPWNLSYEIPKSLKGKTAWIMLTLKEGKRTIHAPMVYLDVE